MSDYTVKREKEGILRIQAEGTKMPGPLTINERDYADDKQLIVGGGSSSPVGLAKVTLLPNDPTLRLNDAFNNAMFVLYYPEEDSYPPMVRISPNVPFTEWNAGMEAGLKFVTPSSFSIKTNSYEYAIEGAAEIINDDENGDYIYVTGDCTITLSIPK